MNEAEQQQIAQMVQGARGGGQMPPQNPAQQPPQQEEAPPGEVYIQLQEILRNWKPQTEEGRKYYEEIRMLLDNLGGM